MCEHACVYMCVHICIIVKLYYTTNHRQSLSMNHSPKDLDTPLYSYLEDKNYSIYRLFARDSNAPVPDHIVMNTLWAHDDY